VPERLGDVRLAHPYGSVEDDRFTALEEAQRPEVADQRRRQTRVVGEVELLEGDLALEARPADALRERLGLAPADLVLKQHLEELEVAELAAAGLLEARLERGQHAGELQGLELALKLMAFHGQTSRWAKRLSGPCSWAGAVGVRSGSASRRSRPAARMPLTVR